MQPRYTSCREHAYSRSPSVSRPATPMFDALPTFPASRPSNNEHGNLITSFSHLPTEIRLQIYSSLLLPCCAEDLLPDYEKTRLSAPDSFDYDRRQHGSDRLATADLTRPTILIRTIDGTKYPNRFASARHIRSSYGVRGDRFRARTLTTTYHALNAPPTLAASLLRTNRAVHAEAAELLYANYTFDFDTHIEAIVPFLRDLTPVARACIRRIRIVKRALPYEKEFDRAEWAAALRYLADPATGLCLRALELGVVAGRPGLDGWADVQRYRASDFDLLKDADDMDWLGPLLELRGLRELDVHAVVEHCPPASNSNAMARFIRFSASIETGFAEFMRDQLLT